MNPEFVLEARGIIKAFPGTVALGGVDFRLVSGRVHALIGENGAGKSTLVKILAGIEQPTAGTLSLDGQPVRFQSVRDAAHHGIGIIHQELQLFPDLTIAENLFVGQERVTQWGLVDWPAQERITKETLGRLGQDLDPRTRVGSLPLGLQQVVEIARALVQNIRILMMDEPTSALTASEIHLLFRVIRDLAAHGVAVVYISHRLEELLEIADSVTVLRDGQIVGEAQAETIDIPWIVGRMTGRPLTRRDRAVHPPRGSRLLSVKNMSLPATPGSSPLDDVSFDLHAGEVLGIYGLMGAGRTELFESLLGIRAGARGEVRLCDRRLDTSGTGARVDAGLAIVPEDRQAAGLVPTLSVLHNMTLSSLPQLSRRGYLSPRAEAHAATPLADALQLKAPDLRAPVGTLSGGNQQKVVIARALMSRPKVLLMDEPTRGVDVAAKAEILDAMRRLAEDGIGVIFATSDLEEIFSTATRVLVMARGRISGQYDAEDVTADGLASAASASPLTQERDRDGC